MADRLEKLLNNSNHIASYMIREITHICRDMKKRAPGSEGEKEAADYMAGILKNECGCREVKTETFKEHPDSFYGYFYITAALNLLACAFFFIFPWLSAVFGALALLLFIFHFVLYRQVIDWIFPEKESVNVTAIRSCSGELRQRIFINGHIDAAWEFPLNYHFGGFVFEIPGVMSVAGAVFYTVVSILKLCEAGVWVQTLGYCGLIFVPFFILLAKTYDRRQVVDGANDNLTGCYMGIALLREMEQQGVDLEHTEIGVILTGSEEAGIRGAKAWAKAHKNDYKDVPTYIVGFDTIHDPRYLMVNRRDLNSTIAADPVICDTFLKAAEKAGVPCISGRVPLFGGSTDGTAFLQGGFRAATITGLKHVLEDYYHTRKDSYDNMNPEGLENCYKATVTFVDMMDQ